MLRNWRTWVMLVLLLGPILVYIGLGAVWLMEHRGPIGFRGELITYATVAWVLSGVLFAVLANRWTKRSRSLLPPLDWDLPQTFSEHDRRGWALVEEAAERSETLPMEDLACFDTYLNSGRLLARRLASHYHPQATDPIDHVPVVELLSALQLAAEDLNHLCREIPGGDLITPAHGKRAVQAAGYLQRANELYTLLLPIFQPVAGIARLGAQKLMVEPAWRNMQQNLLRWFFRAYVNRLGTHLVELYSGRLIIGADQYRKLSRRLERRALERNEVANPLSIAVVGARGAGKSALIRALEEVKAGDLAMVRKRLMTAGFDETVVDLLKAAEFRELPSYPQNRDQASGKARSAWREALAQANDADLLLMVVDLGREEFKADARFLEEWGQWFAEHPTRERPPALAVATHADRDELGEGWTPPYDWIQGRRPREIAVRERLEVLRANLAPTIMEALVIALRPNANYGVSEVLLPALALELHRAERTALLRRIQETAARSKARRLLTQVGRQGRRLWNGSR